MSENVWILLSNMIGHLDGPRIVGWILPLRVQKVPDFSLLEVFAPCHSSSCSSSCDLYGHWTSWHRGHPMLGIAVTVFPPLRSITESTRALGEWVHSAGGWSQGSPWTKAFRAPRPESRCLTEGERGWGPVGEGSQQRSNLAGWAGRALSSWGRGPWSFRDSGQKRSDSGESNMGLRDHGSQDDPVGGGLMQLQEAGDVHVWGQPCSGHSPSVRFRRCPSAGVE